VQPGEGLGDPVPRPPTSSRSGIPVEWSDWHLLGARIGTSTIGSDPDGLAPWLVAQRVVVGLFGGTPGSGDPGDGQGDPLGVSVECGCFQIGG
jgi:hypothetical protein